MKDGYYAFVLRRLATILAVVILTLSFSAAFTGILLAFYYEPTAGGAYNSLKAIATQIPNGWLIQRLHNISGNGIIVVSLIEIVVMFLGERFRRSWLTAWILTVIALSWTAMVLDWSQIGYWRFTIELGSIETIPLIGSQLREIITGGSAINTLTIQHLYTLHSYILSGKAVILAIIHLGGLLLQEREEAGEHFSRGAEGQENFSI